MDNFERDFNRTSSMIRMSFIVIFGLVIASIFFKVYMYTKNGNTGYVIEVPTYGNSQPDSYFTTNYVEKEGCVIFKDEFNMEHKACGAYKITKW